jgi:hypothetical protein
VHFTPSLKKQEIFFLVCRCSLIHIPISQLHANHSFSVLFGFADLGGRYVQILEANNPDLWQVCWLGDIRDGDARSSHAQTML